MIIKELFIEQFQHLLCSQTGVKWDNHETAGENPTEYQYLHQSYSAYAHNYTLDCTEHRLIEPQPVFIDLVRVLSDTAPNISTINFQFLLALVPSYTENCVITINDMTYHQKIIHQYIHIGSVFDFLLNHEYIDE